MCSVAHSKAQNGATVYFSGMLISTLETHYEVKRQMLPVFHFVLSIKNLSNRRCPKLLKSLCVCPLLHRESNV